MDKKTVIAFWFFVLLNAFSLLNLFGKRISAIGPDDYQATFEYVLMRQDIDRALNLLREIADNTRQ